MQQVSADQQQIIDAYASAVAFRLLGIANGELLQDDPAANASILDAAELMLALHQRVEEAAILADELCSRGQANAENQTAKTVMTAEALSLILAGANNAATNLQLEILEEIADLDEDQHRWAAID